MLPTLLLAIALAAPCESLLTLALPDTTILSATLVPEGPFTPPGASATAKPVPMIAACRVAGRVQPAITFEVWMPVSGWNGKFQAVGGGGYAGVISYGPMAAALRRGYATASTDTGHATPGGSWALNRPDLVADFGHRAIHAMTVNAKAIVEAFYGRGPARSYFVGCSTGGRQGLMEAQRYPADYDGIVAGAPANYWSRMPAGNLFAAAATLKDDASRLPLPKLQALNQGAIAACDGRDGVTDGLIEDPRRCTFDPASLQCSGQETEACLTPPQVAAARSIYAPAFNPRTKEAIFPGMPRGSELTWGALTGGPQPFTIAVDFYRYFVFSDPQWDWKTMDFDKDVAAGEAKVREVMDATNPDLRAFKARGGRLLLYHGWNDQLISAFNTIDYYESLVKTMGAQATSEFARLFMAPGMLHCAGGVGPNSFDAVAALERWVEAGSAPQQLLASHSVNGVVDRTRPLCPYPQVAVYTGSGSIDEATSFVCK
jgi:feruloyl esterase